MEKPKKQKLAAEIKAKAVPTGQSSAPAPKRPKAETGGGPPGLLEKVTEVIEEKTGMDRQALKDAAIHALERDASQATNSLIRQGMKKAVKILFKI